MDAVLSALAALAKENPTLANMLAKPSLERDREFFLSFVDDFFSSSRCNWNFHCFSNNTTET